MIELCSAIEEHVARAVADLRMTHPHGDPRAPAVVHGYLPPKKRGVDDEDAPFIIVRPVEGSDTDDGSTVSVAIIFSAYAEDERGVDEVLVALQRVRIALLEERVIEKRFRLRLPLDWRVYEDQPAPYWMAAIVTRWDYPATLEKLEVGPYGSGTYEKDEKNGGYW